MNTADQIAVLGGTVTVSPRRAVTVQANVVDACIHGMPVYERADTILDRALDVAPARLAGPIEDALRSSCKFFGGRAAGTRVFLTGDTLDRAQEKAAALAACAEYDAEHAAAEVAAELGYNPRLGQSPRGAALEPVYRTFEILKGGG